MSNVYFVRETAFKAKLFATISISGTTSQKVF